MTSNTLPSRNPLSTRTLLLGIWGHISSRRRIQFGLLLLVMLLSGGAELLSLGAAVPFLAVLSNPERLWRQPLVQVLADWQGFTQASDLVLPISLAFAAAAVLAALIRLANLWLNGRLAAEVGCDLSCEVYMRTLYQPYEVHLQRNSAEVITSSTTQIGRTVQALGALLQMISALVVGAGLLFGLLFINWPVALGSIALFGSMYYLLAITLRQELRVNSHRMREASTQQLKLLQEGLGAIRDVLLDGNQGAYVAIYRATDRPRAQLQAKNQFLGTFPRYVVEALGMVALALLGALLVLKQGSGGAVIPLLGALALGAQRLLPALQQIYNSWAILKSANANMAAVLSMLNQPMQLIVHVAEPLPLRQKIRLEGVRLRYLPDQPEVLRGLDLDIYCGERIGLIGSTGSGKSTTVDLLMGLLAPTDGRVMVDGMDLHDPKYPERLAGWRAAVAHVPQYIYLADQSFAENIAFGVPRKQIDLGLVRKVAEQAQIANFIETSPQSYDTFVGERGVRLSGGQRQRIGIARALYKQARVLVLDEATSALDNITENAVMEELEGLSRNLTIVMIAHRLTTVQRCDRVIRLDDGLIKNQGPPDQVLAKNA